MTVTIPAVQLSIVQILFALSALGFLMSWLATHRVQSIVRRNKELYRKDHPHGSHDGTDAISAFWVFVAVVSGAKFATCFVIAIVLLLVRGAV